jgi:hypothetical protein
MIILGSALLVASLVVALATWRSDRVLVSPTDLEHWAAAALIPGWGWLMISTLMFSGFRQENYRRRWGPSPPRAAKAVLFAVALACAVTIAGGMFIGGAKGSLRVVGGQYQVSSGSLNSGEWTSVSLQTYRAWESRFLRLDSMFSLFGLSMLAGGAQFRWLRSIDRSPKT